VTALRLFAVSAAICAMLALAPAGALAQTPTVGGVLPPPIPGPGSGSLFPTPIPPQSGMHGSSGIPGFHRFHRGINNGVFIIEDREYAPVVVEEVRSEPAAPPPAQPPEPRKPYVLGRTYNSLPGGCMKLIQGGVSYYHCSGEWYRQVAAGQYKAVRMP
jgi:hypothetical protein